MRSRRFKLPVLSRLAWAWAVFAVLGAIAAVYAAYDHPRARAAVAMAVEGVERLAPPAERAAPEKSENEPENAASLTVATGISLAAERLEQPPSEEAEDALADAVDPYRIAEDPAAEVVITVDGAPARAIGAAREKRVIDTWTPVKAPDEKLLQRTAYGRIPKIGADGRRASVAYAQEFKPGERPNIALIVGGLGINRALTERAIDELPPYVTFAFAPYAKDLPFWTKRARDAGHEILVELPLESRTGDEAALGPAAILTTRTAAENRQRLDWILSRFEGYFGVTNYLGSKYSSNHAAMSWLFSQIDAAGLAFIDDTGALERFGESKDSATVNRLIEPAYGADQSEVKSELQSLEKLADRNGDAIGKTYINDRSFAEIKSWAVSLDERGYALAPASAVLVLRKNDR
ncbi:MAG: divergent polysaccharide deacetylase family protein [Parvularculaceae bacterium]|nr:divergent polysaccharide deacetylase family protein [Parvularculaceae bacterium]